MPKGKLVTRAVQGLALLALAEVFVFWTVAAVIPGCTTTPTGVETETDPSDPVAAADPDPDVTDLPTTETSDAVGEGETPPNIVVNVNPNPCVVSIGETCIQNACQSTNPEGGQLTYDNICPDGSATKNCRQVCTFLEAGEFEMESCVRNQAGVQVCVFTEVTVLDDEAPPTDGIPTHDIVDQPSDTTDLPTDTTDLPTTDSPTTDVPTTDVPTTDVGATSLIFTSVVGAVRAVSSPAAIDCPTTCSGQFPAGSDVFFQYTPTGCSSVLLTNCTALTSPNLCKAQAPSSGSTSVTFRCIAE
ncbi:MAG TPA: hypothetical protein VMR21_15270 [Vicinamibacteria bacterium]|nr:hypothetical protein [Vicinamibacteria bacterium]